VTDESERVDFEDVEVVADTGPALYCRVGALVVGVPPVQMLPGTEIPHPGDRGRLVLPIELAMELGLIDRRA
jgi:hypothetical protein